MRAFCLNNSARIMTVFILLFLTAQMAGLADEDPFQSAEGVVQELYDLVTFEAGTTPDWEKVRSLFIEQGVVVLRTSRQATTVFSVQGFIDDFVRFIDQAKVIETGFKEEIKRMNPMVFGDMATVLVLYEASMPGKTVPPQQGVDGFSLIRKDGRWWIVSIINEIPTPIRPIPKELE